MMDSESPSHSESARTLEEADHYEEETEETNQADDSEEN